MTEKKQHLGVSIDAELMKKFRAVAREDERTPSSLVRKLIKAYVQQHTEK